jgi:RHS repeat-associated protein
MCDGSGATSWKHDKMGRVLSERRTIGAVSGAFQTDTYNLDGSPASVTTLGSGVSYTYSGVAHPLTATNCTGGTTKFVSGASYAPPGELIGATLGSATGFAGFTFNNSYNDRLQPILLSASGPSATVFSESLDFHLGAGDNGNVYQIVNNRDNTRIQSFAYDTLNRISSAQSSGTQWGETFTIDPWGNLTNPTGISGKTHCERLNCPANTDNQVTTCSYGCDAAGNMTSNGTVSYVYDAENRLIATAGYSYIYDGAGAIHYYFTDHLGTYGVAENDTTGTCKQNIDYYPYGGVEHDHYPNAAQNYKFTGKERDTESGLDYFGPPRHASALGRFMSPDPKNITRQRVLTPQQWNRYYYTSNNPLKFVDRDGMEMKTPRRRFRC